MFPRAEGRPGPFETTTERGGLLSSGCAVYTVLRRGRALSAGVFYSFRSRGRRMSIIDLGIVKKIFGGSAPSAEQQKDLVKEVLLMTLARAAAADSNTQPVEVETVQRVLKDATGDEISLADIRVAAASELFERAPLEKYLSSVASALTATDRVTVAQSLAQVIRSDVTVGEQEIDFFNKVVAALDISAAELAGLTS